MAEDRDRDVPRWDDTDPEPGGDGIIDDDSEWTYEDEARYQSRRHEEILRTRRRRRQAASFGVVVLVVLGIGVGAAGIYQGSWQWPFDDDAATAGPAVDCPAPGVTAAPVEGVTVTVLNGTDRDGLAGGVAGQLEARGFTVTATGNAAAEIAEVAQVRHGPEAVLQARTVGAHLPGPSIIDDARAGTDVELTLGAAFVDLNPPDVAASALAPVPAESPSGCVTPAPPDPTDPPADPAATPAG